MPFPAREGVNLMNLGFPGTVHFITTHGGGRGGGKLITNLDFMLGDALIPRGIKIFLFFQAVTVTNSAI